MDKQPSLHLMKITIVWIVLSLLLGACSRPSAPSPDTDAIATTIARGIFATLTIEASRAQPAATLMPSNTPIPEATATTTGTSVPTATSRPTSPPLLTQTVTPKRTVTQQAGVGDLVQCDDTFALRVLQVADFGPFVTSDIPKGKFLRAIFEVTNLQDRTDSLSPFRDELLLKGKWHGRWLTFEPTTYGTSILEKESGASAWWSDLPPGVPVKLKALFDVNAAATDWILMLSAARRSQSHCTVSASLSYTSRAIDGDALAIVTFARTVNLRKGPGTNYSIAGQGVAGQRLEIVGRNADSSWWQTCCVNGKKVWVAASVTSTEGDTSSISVTQDIPVPPLPTATPTSLPRIASQHEYTVSTWGLKLYDVRKTKVVYFFDNADVALGMWLIPFLEIRNLGTGTAEPSYNLNFYLQDERGRTWEYDEFNNAVLGAAWQFQAGHLYDDINPGLVLGIALPFDVPGDLGDIWLRVKQDPNIVLYLGNVGAMPKQEK